MLRLSQRPTAHPADTKSEDTTPSRSDELCFGNNNNNNKYHTRSLRYLAAPDPKGSVGFKLINPREERLLNQKRKPKVAGVNKRKSQVFQCQMPRVIVYLTKYSVPKNSHTFDHVKHLQSRGV
jgi:hypothetical protein